MHAARPSYLPPKELQLNRPQNKIRDGRKGKTKLKANITTKWRLARMYRDGAHPPGLGHARYHACDATAESGHCGNARRQLLWVVVVLWNISTKTALEHEVVGQRDAFVDGKPVSDKVHEVLQHRFEVIVAWNGNGDVNPGCNACPDETRDARCPASQDLDGERDGVDVRAVVGDDSEGEDDETEFAERAEVVYEDCSEQTAGLRTSVSVRIAVLTAVHGCGAIDRNTEHFGEQQGDDESEPGEEEDLAAGLGARLVDGVIRGVGGPTGGEAVDGSAE